MGDEVTKIRIEAEGAPQATRDIQGTSRALEGMGGAGQNLQRVASSLGGVFGQLGAMVGPAGPIAAGIALVIKAAQDAIAISREAEQAVAKVGGSQGAAQLDLKLGGGSADRFAAIGVRAGISREESVRAASMIAGTLDQPEQVERAFGLFANLRGQVGNVDPAYAGAMAQLMGRGMTGEQAMGLTVMGLREDMNAQQVGKMGRVLSQASSFGFDKAEALTLYQAMGDLGAGDEMIVELMRNLGGGSPAAAQTLRKYGLERSGLAARVRALGGMSPEELAAMATSSTPVADLVAQSGRMEGRRAGWARALSGDDMLAGYEAGDSIRREMERQAAEARIEQRRAETPDTMARLGRWWREGTAEMERTGGGVPWWVQGVGFSALGNAEVLRRAVEAGAAEGLMQGNKAMTGF